MIKLKIFRPRGANRITKDPAKVCKQEPGTFIPVIDINRCTGRDDCVEVCPYEVFTMGILPQEQRKDMPPMVKLKNIRWGWRQAFVTNGDACRACGLCVSACPEDAIVLKRAKPKAQPEVPSEA
jgi:4Fe-4S ferredoxin